MNEKRSRCGAVHSRKWMGRQGGKGKGNRMSKIDVNCIILFFFSSVMERITGTEEN